MAISVTCLSTSSVPANLRIEYWSRVLNGLFGQVNLDALGEDTLDCEIEHFTLSRLQLSTLKGTRTRVAIPAESPMMTSNPAVRVLLQSHGVSRFEQDGQVIEFGPDDCLVYDFSRPHRITNLGLTRLHSVVMPKYLLSHSGLKLQRMPAQRVSADATVQIVHGFVESLLNKGAALSLDDEAGMADALFDLLLLIFTRQKDLAAALSHPELLRMRAKGFIAKNLADPELSIEEISNALGCTKRYLHMVFQDEGTTVARYIWQSRLERSHQDIEASANSDKSITDVALSWGFSSSAHFSRLFKERFGFAPSLLRQGKAPSRGL